ncbi:hypothetical protein CHS0354_029115 [Potamilus streckersoni]|uniref:Cyclic nucleotide-binding domain-containing protein n=1 Tax=Potamilus streckersoni TaxID=2493646 RepID=A0AAE0SX49_9BIVA|nr:hypothetical protein CHS0354_029115 [Potamilus streckersoni]
MLSGKTSVHIDTSKSDDDPPSQSEADESASLKQVDDIMNELLLEGDGKKKKPLDRSQFGKCVIQYEDGKSFGEIALISDDAVRNATIIADEDTDLLVIYRDLFNRSMKTKQEKEYAERKDFIESCPLFQNWSSKFKHLLEMSIRKEEYPFGTCIVRQGEPADGLYFIIKGQAKVLAEPSQHWKQYPFIATQVDPVEQELGRHNKENTTRKKVTSFTQDQIRVRRKEGYAAAERRYMSRTVELCCVKEEEIVGDLETVLELQTSAFTVKCTANTAAFVLDYKNYERLVLKKNLHTVHTLKEGVLKKLTVRVATPNGAQIPLLKVVHRQLYDMERPKQQNNARKEEVEKEKQTMLSQMIKLYLKNKVPLIEPMLPDSIHYRIMSERRAKRMAYQEKKREETQKIFYKTKRRVPRSMKQLQNSVAETELMNDRIGTTDNSKLIRPRTAIGIERYSSVDSIRTRRPDTVAGYTRSTFHLTEVNVAEEVVKTNDKEPPNQEGQADQIFEQMEMIQKEKTETRSKIMYSMAAKSEIRLDAQKAHLGKSADELYDMEDENDYFDRETSDSHLKRLEQRIREFCNNVSNGMSHEPLRVNALKRFEIEGTEDVPLPGGTVFVQKKPCLYPPSVQVSPDAHQHVRRFMISRELTTPFQMRPKSAHASTGRKGNIGKYAW